MVKVLCVSDAPDYEQPWQTHGPSSSFGSGAVLQTTRGLRVLTNAHCVANHVFVQVRRYGLAQKHLAQVEAIGHECDLALLKVEDESFFSGITPIHIGPLPRLSDRVSVCGFPIGGERLSITEGIVSRIELVQYAQSHRRLLAVQIDAAINSGNSGGPVFRRGMLAGVAFQALDEGEQIGYMIATPVVAHFLRDVDSGHYRGFPSLGMVTQPLESEAHRRSLGLKASIKGGVMVTRVAHGGSVDGKVRSGDVLLSADGVPIASDGTVALREGELVDCGYVISKRHVGDEVTLDIWRKRARRQVIATLRAPRYLVAEERYELRPSYYVIGGLLFVPLTRNYLMTWGDNWQQRAPRELVTLYQSGIPTSRQSEVVVLQKVMADRVNQGYHDYESVIITAVGGKHVQSLAHLAQVADATRGTYLRFDASDGRVIVIDRKLARKRHDGILGRFGIPRDRSVDLRSSDEAP